MKLEDIRFDDLYGPVSFGGGGGGGGGGGYGSYEHRQSQVNHDIRRSSQGLSAPGDHDANQRAYPRPVDNGQIVRTAVKGAAIVGSLTLPGKAVRIGSALIGGFL